MYSELFIIKKGFSVLSEKQEKKGMHSFFFLANKSIPFD